MNKVVKHTTFNAVLGIVLYFTFYITAFLLGYASSDQYVTNTLILFTVFVLIHILVLLPFHKKLIKNELPIQLGVTILTWIILATISF